LVLPRLTAIEAVLLAVDDRLKRFESALASFNAIASS